MVLQDVLDASTIHRSVLLVLGSLCHFSVRLVIRLDTIGMHRLGFELNSVTGWQLMLSREVQVASDSHHSTLSVPRSTLRFLFQLVPHSSTIGTHHPHSAPNCIGLEAMLRRGVLDANGIRHSNWLGLDIQFLLVSRSVLHSGTNGMHHSGFVPNSDIDWQLLLNRDIQVASDIRRSSLSEHDILLLATSILVLH